MKIIIAECLSEIFKTSHVLLVALLTAKDCRKVVHELYVPKEIGQEFLFVAMTYAVGSLAFKDAMRIGNSQPCLFCRILVCVGVYTS